MTATPTTPKDEAHPTPWRTGTLASITDAIVYDANGAPICMLYSAELAAQIVEAVNKAPAQTAPQTPAPTGRAGPASTSEDADATRSPVGSPVTEPLTSDAAGPDGEPTGEPVCPNCEVGAVVSSPHIAEFQYGEDGASVQLEALVIVHACKACGFGFLDDWGARSHDAAGRCFAAGRASLKGENQRALEMIDSLTASKNAGWAIATARLEALDAAVAERDELLAYINEAKAACGPMRVSGQPLAHYIRELESQLAAARNSLKYIENCNAIDLVRSEAQEALKALDALSPPRAEGTKGDG